MAFPWATVAAAAQWTEYELQGIAFSAPSDWEITYSARDVEYDFESPDKTFKLWARWWFPDEPLLGYGDIVFHDKTTLAGQPVLLTRSESGGERMLQVAFIDRKNADGEIFLFQLIAPMDLTIANHELFMRAATKKLLIDGESAEIRWSKPFGGDLTAAEPAHQPAAPEPQPAPTQQAVAPPSQPPAMGFHHDATYDFSLPQPPGWSIHTASGNGVSQVAVVPPEQDAMVLAIVGTQADTDMALGYLYRDSVIVKSIEDEDYPEIAGQAVHAIETIAKVYTINNVAMPYPRGRVWIYRGGNAERFFIIVSIRAEDVTEARRDALAAIAAGFRFGPPPANAAPPPPAAPEPVAAPPAPAPSPAKTQVQVAPVTTPSGSEWLPQMNARFGGDCRLEPLETWSHPTRGVMEAAQVAIRFVALCQGGTYPVFGVDFPYDQQGETTDYFYPIYIDMLTANGRNAFSFLAIQDLLLSNFALKDSTTLTLEFEEVAAPGPVKHGTGARADPLRDAAAQPPADPPAGAAEPATAVILEANHISDWETFGFSSGQFETDVSLSAEGIRWAIPDGRHWAKTGFIYRGRPIVPPAAAAAQSLEISARIDADASNCLTIAFVDPARDTQDPWDSRRARFQLRRGKDGAFLTLDGRSPDFNKDIPFHWPEGETEIRFILAPGGVFELRDAAGRMLAYHETGTDWPQEPLTLLVYGQVPWKNSAADLLLKQVSLREVPTTAQPAIGALGPRDVSLFDGLQIAPVWTPIQNHDRAFHTHARLADGTLRVGWPPEDGTKYVGLFSPEPVIWLDDFFGPAEARIEVDLDSAETGDFEIGLQQPFSLYHNRLSNNAWVASWRRQPDGTFTLRQEVHTKEPVILTEGLRAVPDSFAIVISPEGIGLDGPGLPADLLPWNQLHDGAGLRLWAYAVRPQEGPAAFALRNIVLRYQPGTRQTPEPPAPGIAPLPEAVLFDGTLTDAWAPQSQGDALFADLARQTGDGVLLARREAPPNHNRIGLASAERIVALDYRIERTPYRLNVDLDPQVPNLSGWIYLSGNPAEPFDTAGVAVELQRLQAGADAGKLRVRLYSGHMYYAHIQRLLPEDWLQDWDGRVTFLLQPGRVTLQLGDTVTHAITTDRVTRNGAWHIVVQPGQRSKRVHGAIGVRRITNGWVTPGGMTEAERWNLVDADSFDPDAFADLMAIEAMGN